MTNKPQHSQATRLQLQLNLNTATHQLPHQGDPQSTGPVPCQFQKQKSNITFNTTGSFKG